MQGLISPVTTTYNFANRKKPTLLSNVRERSDTVNFRNISAIISYVSHYLFEFTVFTCEYSCELTSHERPDILDIALNTFRASEFFEVREESLF